MSANVQIHKKVPALFLPLIGNEFQGFMGTLKKNLPDAVLQNTIDIKWVLLLKHFWNCQHLENNSECLGDNTLWSPWNGFQAPEALSIALRPPTVRVLFVILETNWFPHFSQLIAVLRVDTPVIKINIYPQWNILEVYTYKILQGILWFPSKDFMMMTTTFG